MDAASSRFLMILDCIRKVTEVLELLNTLGSPWIAIGSPFHCLRKKEGERKERGRERKKKGREREDVSKRETVHPIESIDFLSYSVEAVDLIIDSFSSFSLSPSLSE